MGFWVRKRVFAIKIGGACRAHVSAIIDGKKSENCMKSVARAEHNRPGTEKRNQARFRPFFPACPDTIVFRLASNLCENKSSSENHAWPIGSRYPYDKSLGPPIPCDHWGILKKKLLKNTFLTNYHNQICDGFSLRTTRGVRFATRPGEIDPARGAGD